MIDPYQTLGVAKDASAEEIKKAYRKKAMASHPDQGGDEAAFKSVALAYRILSDEEKRKRYDAGENADSVNAPEQTDEQKAIGVLAQLYLQIVENTFNNLETQNLIELMLRQIEHGQAEATRLKAQCEQMIARFENAMNRMQAKTGENILSKVLEGKMREGKKALQNIEDQRRIGDVAKEILKNYEYDFAEAPPSELPQNARNWFVGIVYSGWK